MKFIILIKADKKSESGIMPSQELITEMLKFNEELVNAGIMQAVEGLHPSSKGARVNFSGDKVTVTDGPFAETKEVLAGYQIIECPNLDEALEIAGRFPPLRTGASVEVRPIRAEGGPSTQP